MTLAVGWHYLESSDTAPPLPSATFLDVGGVAAGMRSPLRLERIYFKGRPPIHELVAKVRAAHARGNNVQLGNEQNHPIEEWPGTASDFAALFHAVKAQVPEASLWWPAPSPGFPGWQQWYDGATYADGVTVHAYGTLAQMQAVTDYVLKRFPNKSLWISECNFGPGPGRRVNRDEWAHSHLVPFLDWCARFPNIIAVSYFAYVWPNADMEMTTPVDGRGTQIEQVLRAWKAPKEEEVVDRLSSLLAVELAGNFKDLRGKLPVLYPNDPTRRYKHVDSRGMPFIVIHHSTGLAGPVTPELIANHHVHTNGWWEIGYHFVIDEGVLYYVGDVDTQRAHVKSRNHEALGVCFSGEYHVTPPTAVDVDIARRTVRVLDAFYGHQKQLTDHRSMLAGQGYSCPGDRLAAVVPTLRAPSIRYVVGPGVLAAMQRRGDVPRSNEEYRASTYSITRGRTADYAWLKDDPGGVFVREK